MNAKHTSRRARRHLGHHPRQQQIVPGASPGTLTVHDPRAPKPTVRLISFNRETVHDRTVGDLNELRSLLHDDLVHWINVDGVGDPDLLGSISDLFGLHGLALEDVVNVPQRPKLEPYDEHLFIIAHMPTPGNPPFIEQLSLFLGTNFVLTFQEVPGDCLDPVRKRIAKGGLRIRTLGPDYLAYAVLDAIVDAYFPVVDRYSTALESLETEILEHPDDSQLRRLHVLKREMLGVRRIMWGLREIFIELRRDDNTPFLSPAVEPYLRDCYDHTIQLVELLESYRELGSSLMDFHLSTVSHKMNEVMKVLTIIATIFIPLGFIAGLYGMNFDPARSPWNMPELGWYWGYPFALGLMLALAVGFIVYFQRRGWIGGAAAADPRQDVTTGE